VYPFQPYNLIINHGKNQFREIEGHLSATWESIDNVIASHPDEHSLLPANREARQSPSQVKYHNRDCHVAEFTLNEVNVLLAITKTFPMIYSFNSQLWTGKYGIRYNMSDIDLYLAACYSIRHIRYRDNKGSKYCLRES
jgi:hypothetical protein